MNKRWIPPRMGSLAAVIPAFTLSTLLLSTVACNTRSAAPPVQSNRPRAQSPQAIPPPPPPAPQAAPPSQHTHQVKHAADRAPASGASDDAQIDQAIASLKKGNLVYNTPTNMKTGQSAHVVARIGSDKVSVGTLESGMPAGQGTQTAATPVSTKMKMALTSADFDITPLSSEEQLVAGDTPTTWEWEIVPKHSGTLSLHLAAVVELENISRDFTTVDRNVAVQVDPLNTAENFFQTNTVWVLGIIGAAIASIWAWLKKQKKPKSPDWETP